jgi:hypothetical protein
MMLHNLLICGPLSKMNFLFVYTTISYMSYALSIRSHSGSGRLIHTQDSPHGFLTGAQRLPYSALTPWSSRTKGGHLGEKKFI